MAANDPSQCKPRALERTVALERAPGVFRTAGIEPAVRTKQRPERILVATHGELQHASHGRAGGGRLSRSPRASAAPRELGRVQVWRSRSDIETQCGVAPNPQHLAQHPSEPVAVDGARQLLPADHIANPSGSCWDWRDEQLDSTRVQTAPVVENPRERRWAPQPIRATQTARRTRPLARRARRTLRPPTDRIRARKPWVRLRRMTEG